MSHSRPHLDQAAFLRLVRGEDRGLAPSAARAALSLPAAGYRLAMAARNAAYDHRWLPVHRADVPVIAVGNLTLGGTGKTPMVEWLARWFRARGVRVAILSRGYGATSGVNDEGRVLEENLPDVPHLQAPDRVGLARIAVEELAAEVLILDDGFQHRRLARDLDIVLLDALDPFGLGRVCPRGLLREPPRALRRAGLIVLTRADLVDASRRAAIRREAERHAGPLRWAEARHAPLDLRDAEGSVEPLAGLGQRRVAAFCGIGNPDGFRRTLEALAVELAGFRVYPDHHDYSREDVAALGAWARELGAELALTTQKDLVKLRTATLGGVPLRAVRIGMELLSGLDEVEGALRPVLRHDEPPG